MAITSSDIKFRKSVVTGSAGNSTAGGSAGSGLGKYMSTTDIVDATLNNCFPDVTGDENAASNDDYQCVFIYNSHGTLTWQNVKVWLSAEVSGGVGCAIGIDTTAASANNASSAQALQIADKDTAPAGVSFSSPTSKATGLSLGNLAAGECRAVWVRRLAANSAALNNDGVSVRAEGDTAA